MVYAQIAPHARLPVGSDELTYSIPADLLPDVTVGRLVRIRLRSRTTLGVVTQLTRRPPAMKLLPITQVLPITLPPELLALGRQIQAISWQPLGLCYASLIPPVLKRFPSVQPVPEKHSVATRASQALTIVGGAKERYAAYVQLAIKALQANQSAVIVFGHQAHLEAFVDQCPVSFVRWDTSAATGERWRRWQRAATKPQLIVGVRSAVTAPSPTLGLVIIDEPGLHGHKDDQAPYLTSARIARLRQAITNCHLVFGGVIPQLGSPTAVSQLPTPMAPVQLIASNPLEANLLQEPLAQWIQANVATQDRLFVFLNRVGQGIERCTTCGAATNCPRCKHALIRRGIEANCSVCRWRGPRPERCTTCGGSVFSNRGTGTETVSIQLEALLHQTVAVVDRNHPVWPSSNVRVLVGTLFAIPYLPMNRPTWSVLLDVDSLRQAAAYDASEQALRLIAELQSLTERAVVIETKQPDDSWLRQVQAGQFKLLRAEELSDRKRFGYPPTTTLVAFRSTSAAALNQLTPALAKHPVTTIGPANSQLIAKVPHGLPIHKLLKRISPYLNQRDIRVEIDPRLGMID